MKQRYLPLLLFLFLFTNCTKNPDSVSNLHLKVEPVRELSNLANIQYGSNKDTSGKIVSLTMDLYFPAGATSAGNYPLVMMIHGGSYLNGDKTDLTSYCNILADSGFVVASINYRLGWRVGNGECKGDTISLIQAGYRALQDANAAMRFLMTNAKLYGLDTGRVFAGGSSAGSSLALNLAFIHNNDLNLFTPVEFSLLGPINTADNNLTSSFKI